MLARGPVRGRPVCATKPKPSKTLPGRSCAGPGDGCRRGCLTISCDSELLEVLCARCLPRIAACPIAEADERRYLDGQHPATSGRRRPELLFRIPAPLAYN